MGMLTINDVLKGRQAFEDKEVGIASRQNIRKEGTVYHVITTSWRRRWLFDVELALYRKDLLHELCMKHGIIILFSVTMPTHTHEVFITPDWETLSNVIKLLNSNVAKHVRRYMHDRIKNRKHVFGNDPAYIMVCDIIQLFFLGRYIYKNYLYLKEEGKPVPDSCFWLFEKNYLTDPYNPKLYMMLFGMEPNELLLFYASHSDAEVRQYAAAAFSGWTKEDNERLFMRQR